MKNGNGGKVGLTEIGITIGEGFQREIRLNNLLTSINTIFVLILLFDPLIRSYPTFVLDIIVSAILGISVLFLNRRGLYYYARFISNIFFLPLHFFAILFAGEILPIMYDIFSYATLAYLIYPIFTLNYTREKSVFVLAIFINLLLLSVHEIVFAAYKSDYQIDYEWFLLFKAFQVITWVMISSVAFTSKMINIRSEAKMAKANQELQRLYLQNKEYLKEISAQNEEMVAQNEEMVAQNEVLISQQEQLTTSNKYIQEQNAQLKEYQQKLERQLSEITLTKTELENKEAINQSILDSLRQNFNTVVYDPDGKMIHISPIISKNLEIASENLINRKADEAMDDLLVSPPDWDFDKEWKRILSGELKSQVFELKIGKRRVHSHMHYSPIHNAKGEIIMVLSIGEDITPLVNQRKEIEKSNKKLKAQRDEINAINNSLEVHVRERTEELQTRNAQLAEYAFINAHILRAPVSSILGLINLLQYEKLSEKEKELFKHLLSAADNLNEVVGQINSAIEQNAVMNRKHFNT